MTQTTETVNGIALLSNVVAFGELVTRVKERTLNMPALGCFYGKSGLGKSCAAGYARNIHKAYYVEVQYSWSRKYFLEMLMKEMGIVVSGTIPHMVEVIKEQLRLSKRPLFVDECDEMVRKGFVPFLKDFSTSAPGGIIMIGEEGLYNSLNKWPQLHNRVLRPVEAKPCTLEDCAVLASLYAPDIAIGEDLLQKIVKTVGGCTRRVCVALDSIREFAEMQGMDSINAETYTEPIFTGRAY